MRLTILGSGTSTGVPIPGCDCSVCQSTHPRNNRTRTSAFVEIRPGTNILIDATTDLRTQALRERLKRVSAVLFTHSHADHILGIDDLRAFNFAQRSAIPCYGTAQTFADITHIFSYAFKQNPLYVGGGVPKMTLHEIDGSTPFQVEGITIQPIPLLHGNLPVTGFRFGELAYLTDTNCIPEGSLALLQGVRFLVLDGLRYEDHSSHFTIPQSIAAAQSLAPERTWLIHMTHTVDYEQVNAQLPAGIELAYDGLQIEFT